MTKDSWPRLVIWLIPIILSIIALAKMPYGYYQFLRIVICIAAGYITYREFKLKDKINAWVILFVLLVILFNPIIPIHLTREVWAFFNMICAALFTLHLYVRIKNNHFND